VVEGKLGTDGTFHAITIMAKHSEEYRAPSGAVPGHDELLRTLRPSGGSGGASGTPR
jgi:cytochrome c-type biogenesis protein CcmE